MKIKNYFKYTLLFSIIFLLNFSNKIYAENVDELYKKIDLFSEVLEKIKEKGGLTDKELVKILVKNEIIIPDDEFNKILLDLEIMGLITVSWMTKDSKRIDIISVQEEEDEYEEQIQKTNEKDYEASFPGTD